MSFSAEWLALRAGADARARSADLVAAAARHLAGTAPTIVDLGAGTGATLHALRDVLPRPQRWLLVDRDPALLAVAASGAPAGAVATLAADLATDPAPWRTVPGHASDLVTASALFDLVSPAWIERFAAALAASGAALLALLTYDGRLALAPPHPDDARLAAALNAHQRTDKGFGPAAGPDAAGHLAAALAGHGYRVRRAPSPWRLETPRDAALIAATLDGWAAAAGELEPERAAAVAAWRAHHRAARRLVVGHEDLLALPPA